MTAGIYSLLHVQSGKRYVGQSQNIEARLRQHRYGHKMIASENMLISKAIKEHGWDAFRADILEVCEGDRIPIEKKWINDLGSLAPAGYNATKTHNGGKASRSRSESVSRCQAKQIQDGWKRVNLRLPPDAAADLDRECAMTGLGMTTIIASLLAETRKTPGTK